MILSRLEPKRGSGLGKAILVQNTLYRNIDMALVIKAPDSEHRCQYCTGLPRLCTEAVACAGHASTGSVARHRRDLP